MYSAILCDDDEIILEGMKYFIEQEFPDILLAATAADGLSCRTHIEEIKPDILITDIRLPDCLGFDLIECAQRVNENAAIIIISGYDDFQYAQKALRAGALGYISKPIDLEEFSEILNTAKERCFQTLKNDLLNRRSFLSDILNLKLTDDFEINAKAHALNLSPDDYYAIAAAELDTDNPHFKQNEFPKQQNTIKNFAFIAEQYPPDNFFLLRYTMQQYIFLVHSDQKEQLEAIILNYHRTLHDHTAQNESCCITVTYGRTISRLSDLRKSYEDALSAMSFKFVIGTSSCIGYKDIRLFLNPELIDSANLNLSQLAEISINDKDQLEQKLSQIYLHLRPLGHVSRSYAHILLEQAIFSISKEVSQYDIAMSDIFTSPVTELQNILHANSLKLMLENFSIFFKTAVTYIEHHQHNKYAKIISNALKYIADNLNRSDLSVNDVAKHVYLSTGYFSLIFKNQTGETFSDYLINLRIEKAKELIRQTNMKFFEISYLIGYENVSHFNVIFKKYTGCTPSQYRRQSI